MSKPHILHALWVIPFLLVIVVWSWAVHYLKWAGRRLESAFFRVGLFVLHLLPADLSHDLGKAGLFLYLDIRDDLCRGQWPLAWRRSWPRR